MGQGENEKKCRFIARHSWGKKKRAFKLTRGGKKHAVDLDHTQHRLGKLW